MLKKSFFTLLSKSGVAIVSFLMAVITARYLGAEGRGMISLFVLNLTVIFMVNNFVGGPGLVYLFPRHRTAELNSAAYLWALVSSITTAAILCIPGFSDWNFFYHLVFLSFFQSVLRIQGNYLLSKEKIIWFNAINALFPLIMLVLMYVLFAWSNKSGMDSYFTSFYASLLFSLLVSSAMMIRWGGFHFSKTFSTVMKKAFRLGFIIQAANILQLLNYRFSFYLLNYYSGKQDVGVFSMATSFAEACWLIINSFVLIQFARISNSSDDKANIRLTFTVMRIALVLTVLPVCILLLLPNEFFTWLLGDEFFQLPGLFMYMVPGIFSLVFSAAIAHYFSGSGKPLAGFVASATGFVVTVLCGFWLVPRYGISGAAWTASASYLFTACISLYLFYARTPFRWSDFVVKKNDWKEIFNT